jgi:hypothetical protein
MLGPPAEPDPLERTMVAVEASRRVAAVDAALLGRDQVEPEGSQERAAR